MATTKQYVLTEDKLDDLITAIILKLLDTDYFVAASDIAEIKADITTIKRELNL